MKGAHSLATSVVNEVSEGLKKGSDWLEAEAAAAVCKCSCKAHLCDELYSSVVSQLVTIQPPLCDASGNLLPSVLLPYLFKAADLHNVMHRSAQSGTCGVVHFILRLPSGTDYMYTGWPDFHCIQKFSLAERQLGKPVGLEESIRAIGEVQSPKGNLSQVKDRAFAQAGIYTLGHFVNTSTNKLATVARILPQGYYHTCGFGKYI